MEPAYSRLGGRIELPYSRIRTDGHEITSHCADPLFVDYAARNYAFQPASPALEMGIEPLDPSRMGRSTQVDPDTPSSPDGPLAYNGFFLLLRLPPGYLEARLELSSLKGELVITTVISVEATLAYALNDLAEGWYLARVVCGGHETLNFTTRKLP